MTLFRTPYCSDREIEQTATLRCQSVSVQFNTESFLQVTYRGKSYLVIFKEEKRLDKGEEKVENVNQDEDRTFTRFRGNRLEVGCDVESVQGHTPECKCWGK